MEEAKRSGAFKSDYESFLDSQIAALLAQENAKNEKLSRVDELTIAIDFCKKYLLECSTSGDERRKKEVLAKLIELKLELELLKDFEALQINVERPIKKMRGHEFIVQSTSGRNPYCEVCLSTIWRLAQEWRRCSVCGFRTHDKCLDDVKRFCVNLGATDDDQSPMSFKIRTESTLSSQDYQCAECHVAIGFEESTEAEPRFCDYSGKYYCRRCHWNDEMMIPARLIHNWDSEKRSICRASKQLLVALAQKPLIDLPNLNPTLFKYVNVLQKIDQHRKTIMLMKCYFVSCKVAKKLRILQYLNKCQHFVETDYMYTFEDLTRLCNGKLLPEIEVIVSIFRTHITKDCEICKGNAFICELCDSKERIYPFSENVSLCKTCGCVFHRPCFDRASKRCTRCKRRRIRKESLAAINLSDLMDDTNK